MQNRNISLSERYADLTSQMPTQPKIKKQSFLDVIIIPKRLPLNKTDLTPKRRREKKDNPYDVKHEILMQEFSTPLTPMKFLKKRNMPKQQNSLDTLKQSESFENQNNSESPRNKIVVYSNIGVSPKNTNNKFNSCQQQYPKSSFAEKFQQIQQNQVPQILSNFGKQESNRKRSESFNI